MPKPNLIDRIKKVSPVSTEAQKHHYAQSFEEMMAQAYPVQVALANAGKNESCNVQCHKHWWTNTASLVFIGKTKTLLITSNN